MKKEQEQQLKYENNKKSVAVAILLTLFVGGLGIHRFYLGKTGTGIAILSMTILGVLGLLTPLAFLLAVSGIWAIIDLFLVSGYVREHNERIAKEIFVD